MYVRYLEIGATDIQMWGEGRAREGGVGHSVSGAIKWWGTCKKPRETPN